MDAVGADVVLRMITFLVAKWLLCEQGEDVSCVSAKAVCVLRLWQALVVSEEHWADAPHFDASYTTVGRP